MTHSKRLLQIFPAVVLTLTFLSLNGCSSPGGKAYVQNNYDKQEYYIEMRDGVKLFTVVYTPKDNSEKYPIMLTRTPYSSGPYGKDTCKEKLGPSDLFEKEGFIFVYQDVRGRFMSEGKFIDMRPYISNKKDKND